MQRTQYNTIIINIKRFQQMQFMPNNLNQFMKIQQLEQLHIKPQKIKSSTYIPGQNNGKWSDHEQMKYIAFIDFYKDKMRSKEKRKSNQFYNEMSQFITSRNGLQCRSHHQKLQEKYVSTNKIITAFKEKFDAEQYKNILVTLKKAKNLKIQSTQRTATEDSLNILLKMTKDAQVQTDLQGLHMISTQNNNNNMFYFFGGFGIFWDHLNSFYPSQFFFQLRQ